MNVKVFKKYKAQNKFAIWSSILIIFMIVSQWVGGWVVSGRWVGGSMGRWSVVLIKPESVKCFQWVKKEHIVY